jgi:lipid II:glycine glycyltransferase (peptidoglycan interpeptide bridge formation enzyme)
MCGPSRGHREGHEGQGEVIEVTVSPVALSDLGAAAELLQSDFWARFKQGQGWTAHVFAVRAGSFDPFPLMVLTRPLARLFSIAYVPFGPPRDPGADRGAMLAGIARALAPLLPRGTLFLRFDLPWIRDGEAPRVRGPRGVRKAASDMQPASTVIVDIAPPADAILSALKPKTRYNIRLAAKKGVVVEEGSAGDLDAWYELYRETAQRDRIGIHARRYYAGLLDAARAESVQGARVLLLVARHEGDLLAGNIVAFWKDRAVYLYGASSGNKRNLMPTYALQWAAILRAQAAGCTTYDLFGVPPHPDPRHPMSGLYQFKTGFGPVTERWGTWDAVYRPVACAGYRAAEGLRMFWYRGLRKLARGRSRGGES